MMHSQQFIKKDEMQVQLYQESFLVTKRNFLYFSVLQRGFCIVDLSVTFANGQ